MKNTDTTTNNYSYIANGRTISVTITCNKPSRAGIKRYAEAINQMLIEDESKGA